MNELAREKDPETYLIINAAMTVHRELGHGFLENVYQEAMTKELFLQNIPFKKEFEIPIQYKGIPLAVSYRADFICFEKIIVELKALKGLTNVDKSQVINYLKATKLERGLLINFGTPSLEFKRIVLKQNLRESAKSADK